MASPKTISDLTDRGVVQFDDVTVVETAEGTYRTTVEGLLNVEVGAGDANPDMTVVARQSGVAQSVTLKQILELGLDEHRVAELADQVVMRDGAGYAGTVSVESILSAEALVASGVESSDQVLVRTEAGLRSSTTRSLLEQTLTAIATLAASDEVLVRRGGQAQATTMAAVKSFVGGVKPIKANVTIPTDYPTIQAALDAYDAAGRLVEGGAIFNIQLPSTVDRAKLTERFIWTDRDYSRVAITGATPLSTVVTGWAFGTYQGITLEFTVANPAVAAAAKKVGYVLIERGDVGTAENACKVVGHWKIRDNGGSNPNTVWCTWEPKDGSGAPVFEADKYRLTVMATYFKCPALDPANGNPAPWMYLNRSRGPLIQDIAVVGGAYDDGYVAVDNHVGIGLVGGNSEIRFSSYGGISNSRGVGVVLAGFFWGMVGYDAAKVIGGVACCGCASHGLIAFNDTVFNLKPGISSGNGRFLAQGAGLVLYGASKVIAGHNAFSRPSYFVGNAGLGVGIFEQSEFMEASGAIFGNAGTDIQCDGNSRAFLYAAGQVTLGSASPAINTVGNSNSYIKR